MTLYQIRIYHNTESRFLPYQDGHRLTLTLSHWHHRPDSTSPEEIADWAFHTFNADLDRLEHDRTAPGGETAFLLACVYRLLRLRSLSVGDVVQITADTEHWWLACDPVGWQRIHPPDNLDGQPLTAETVYRHLTAPAGTRPAGT